MDAVTSSVNEAYDLIATFNQYFEVLLADTSELKEMAFRLRYQVYCEEMKFPDFNSVHYPQGMETDEYDIRSVHILLHHRPSGRIAGTARLILPDLHNPNAPFPLEVHASQHLYTNVPALKTLPRRTVAEISRLILAKEFRSRPGEHCSPYGTAEHIPALGNQGRRRFPHPALGLFVGIMRVSCAHHITHWYAGMEPVLNRLLRHFALELTPISPVLEYHGLRRSYLGVINESMERLYYQLYPLWNLLTEGGRNWPAPSVELEAAIAGSY